MSEDTKSAKTEDQVRVLRLIEYEGPRSLVEEQIKNSIHGSRMTMKNQVRISVVTLDQFPQVLEEARNISRSKESRRELK